MIIAVAVTLAATTTACSSDESPSTSAAPPAPKVVQLRATGTTGLVRTRSDGAGLAADGFGRLRPTENGPGQLVAATVWPANKTAPARWSADDGRSWQPVAMPADAGLDPSRTRFMMVDDLAMVVSGADPGGLGRLPKIWTATDAATTFRTSTMTGHRVDDPDAVIEIDGAVPERIEGEYVVFAHIGVEPIRLASSDGRRWTVTPVEVDGTEGIFDFDAVVAFGDGLVASDHHGAFGSEDGGRTWATLELPGHRFEPGTSAGAARVVGRTAYFSTADPLWTSDDGRTWHTVRDVPVERAKNEPAPRTGIGVLLADDDRLAARIGTEIGDTAYRADLGWSDDGGATWTPADGIPNCPLIEHRGDRLGDRPGRPGRRQRRRHLGVQRRTAGAADHRPGPHVDDDPGQRDQGRVVGADRHRRRRRRVRRCGRGGPALGPVPPRRTRGLTPQVLPEPVRTGATSRGRRDLEW